MYATYCRCTLQIKQKSSTNATSSLRAKDGSYKLFILAQNFLFVHFCVGKWDNLFTAVMVFTNTGDSDLAITNLEGYYCMTGKWGMLMGVAVIHMADFHRRWTR